jgi:hypothetical protein
MVHLGLYYDVENVIICRFKGGLNSKSVTVEWHRTRSAGLRNAQATDALTRTSSGSSQPGVGFAPALDGASAAPPVPVR